MFERVERQTGWTELGEWSYALGTDSIKQSLLLRRRPEADGPRVEAVPCSGVWLDGRRLPEHDPHGWEVAMLTARSAA